MPGGLQPGPPAFTTVPTTDPNTSQFLRIAGSIGLMDLDRVEAPHEYNR